MTDRDILFDLLDCLAGIMHRTLEGLTQDALRWQPDKEANSIAVTVWHVSRAWDVFKVRLFANQPVTEELWQKNGWAAKTGYDPTGIGWGGFGNVAGYSLQEVAAIPALSAAELLAYFDQVYEALRGYLDGLPVEALHGQAAGWSRDEQTVYEWLINLIIDGSGHLGEIKAIKHMWERKARLIRQEAEGAA